MNEQGTGGDAAASTRIATANIDWAEFPNDDIGEDEPDSGWYITLDFETGQSVDIGPDYYGPGCQSLDEALRIVDKWASGRGLTVHRPLVRVAITRDPLAAPGSTAATPTDHGPA